MPTQESVNITVSKRERRYLRDRVAALNRTSVALSRRDRSRRGRRGHRDRLCSDGGSDRGSGGRAPTLHVGVGRGGRKNSECKEDVEE